MASVTGNLGHIDLRCVERWVNETSHDRSVGAPRTIGLKYLVKHPTYLEVQLQNSFYRLEETKALERIQGLFPIHNKYKEMT